MTPRWNVAIRWLVGTLSLLVSAGGVPAAPPGQQDMACDTWAATDGLGRRVPSGDEVGPPRKDRTVGMFYFLWHGAHIQGGPYDIAQILSKDPEAMQKPESPLWGPLLVPHHWGESIFGYYRADDPWVLRKHAQMLSDAGVDVVIFDVTNQFTYRTDYMALLREWSTMRALGNRTPQVAFLTPFWNPGKVMRELWSDLYSTGAYRDLWFEWDGKPLVLADPELLLEKEENTQQDHPAEIGPGLTVGQTFRTTRSVNSVGGRFPTWGSTNSSVTLTLRRDGPQGEVLGSQRFTGVRDNDWLRVALPEPVPAGVYCLTAGEVSGKLGWWSHRGDVLPGGTAMEDGQPAVGDRTLRWTWADETTVRMREAFTFRKPQPDYFRGPTEPEMWSWLEVAPQHVFRNSRGEKEQMSVGVAQNAVNGRLGSMSEPRALGRSHHGGRVDARPDAVRWGFNFAEQWANALREDPRFVFVTGWNEWIAGRFAEFNGVKRPVMFVDQFDQEHSRDIEPMKGGHGDDYWMQFVGMVRRYKGARTVGRLSGGTGVRMDGRFEDWEDVQPEFRDTIGDVLHRRHAGWGAGVIYTNDTGRNDLVSARVSWTPAEARFLVRTGGELSPSTDARWMYLFIDSDGDPRTGWLGFDHVLNRRRKGEHGASVERNVGGRYEWAEAGEAEVWVGQRGLEVSVPWRVLGRASPPPVLEFKWSDNLKETGEWSDFTVNGDSAPNDRFRFRAVRE